MLLQVESVVKRFGGLIALEHVDLQVEQGEIVGVIGPNGAGKSTLLNVIAGVHKPTSGSVHFAGQLISGLNPDRICQMGIARTFQIPHPFNRMTAFENVLVAATFGSHQHGKTAAARAQEMLDFVAFPVDHQTAAHSLNTAQLRRLDLARALSSQPKLLLLDESAAGLTPNELIELQQLVFKIRDQGTTILIVEHLMRLIMQLCDRIIVLHYGVKIAEGTPAEIVSNENVTQAYLGEKYLL
ncbi:MAG: ABC transporter ATP-binding protein [Chloroflexi bacterium RBG_16_57_11]|nr:MAG: ABC transporter ATP-binding protein [Chloroflexi bacterium RBG_16_57_11]